MVNELQSRTEDLKSKFTEQLLRWGMGDDEKEVSDVVSELLGNVDPEMTWGQKGRSQDAAELERKHRDVLLRTFEMSNEEARSLATSLVLWGFVIAAGIIVAKSEVGADDSIAAAEDLPVRHRIVFVTGEWFPRNGGISTFNSALAKSLAELEQSVVCYLPRATEEEVSDASRANVRLIVSQPSKFINDLSAQLLIKIPDELRDFHPDLIVGHDRRSGGIAIELRDRFFAGAKTCVIAHTAPHAIEKFKTDRKGIEEIAFGAEVRTAELVRNLHGADVAIAVGPRLQRKMMHVVGIDKEIGNLIPGCTILDKRPPIRANRFILLFGRAEDSYLKGIDLAHDVARVLRGRGRHAYEWGIRGVPEGDLPGFIQKYRHFELSERYSPDPIVVESAIERSTLVLMPSLEEGFGLVALEAIAHNRPVLISAESGVAEYLRKECPDAAEFFIVSTIDRSKGMPRFDNVVREWVKAIERVFDNWETAESKLKQLREKLKANGDWRRAGVDFLSLCFPI